MTEIQPIDSAFTGGYLGLAPLSGCISPDPMPGDEALPLTGTLPVSVLIMAFTVLCIANIRTFTDMAPSFAGCLFRWKENMNLEDSALSCISRNRIYWILVVPFCILAASYRLYAPEFLSGLAPLPYFFAVCGIFAAYLGLRTALFRAVRGRKINAKAYKAAIHTFRTFFIIIATVLLAVSGVLEAVSADESLSKQILLYTGALLYAVLLIREVQIFRNYCSVLSAILYLCALEFLPTGILVASAIVL